MNERFILIPIFLSLFSSCSIVNIEDEYLYFDWAKVEKIQILSNERGKIKLKVNLVVPSPCHEYHTRESNQVDDTVYVKYYSKVKKGIPCILILGSIELEDVFVLSSNKDYFFRFFQEQGKFLDTLIHLN